MADNFLHFLRRSDDNGKRHSKYRCYFLLDALPDRGFRIGGFKENIPALDVRFDTA